MAYSLLALLPSFPSVQASSFHSPTLVTNESLLDDRTGMLQGSKSTRAERGVAEMFRTPWPWRINADLRRGSSNTLTNGDASIRRISSSIIVNGHIMFLAVRIQVPTERSLPFHPAPMYGYLARQRDVSTSKASS